MRASLERGRLEYNVNDLSPELGGFSSGIYIYTYKYEKTSCVHTECVHANTDIHVCVCILFTGVFYVCVGVYIYTCIHIYVHVYTCHMYVLYTYIYIVYIYETPRENGDNTFL